MFSLTRTAVGREPLRRLPRRSRLVDEALHELPVLRQVGEDLLDHARPELKIAVNTGKGLAGLIGAEGYPDVLRFPAAGPGASGSPPPLSAPAER